MRVLHLSSEYPPQQVYGLGRYVRELAEAQTAAGHSVEVFTNSMGGDQKDIISEALEVRRVHFPPPPKAPVTSAMIMHFNLQLIERCLEQRLNGTCREYSVIHAHDWLTVPAAFHIGRLLKTPVVVTLHDVIFNKVRHREFTAEDEFIAGIENWVCHFAAKILVMSEFVREEIVHSYHAEQSKIVVIPGGVAIQPLEASELPASVSFRRRFADDSENLMLYAGRLDAEKGLPTLLDAAKLLRERKKSGWKMIIAGSGRLNNEIQTFIELNHLGEHVLLVGYLPFDQLRLAYASADIAIVPSTYEPFGLVSLEAQRMGTPVICAETGGLRETLAVTQGGISFPISNAELLFERMIQLLDDTLLRQNLSSNALRNVPMHFNWQLVARRIDYAYRTMENKPPENIFSPDFRKPTPPSNKSREISASQRKRPVDTVNSIVVIGRQNSADLQPVLDCLSRLHALDALDGTVYAIVDKERKTSSTVNRVEFLTKPDSNTLDQKIRNSSFVLVMEDYPDSYRGVLENVPIVWWKDRPAGRRRGKIVDELRQLYAVANKLLCDNRMRKALAPSLENSIEELRWSCTARDKKRVLHVLPQLVTGGAETTLLEIVKGTRESILHSILCLGPISGPIPEEFNALEVPLIQSHDTRETMALLADIAPEVLHLHSMSYIPHWIPVHRRLAGSRILETEHVVNIGSGHFGPVDRVVCVSNATRHAHEPYFRALAESDVKFELIYNGITEKEYSNLPSTSDARKRLKLPIDKPIIGRVSALARNKLPINALKAFKVTAVKIPDALFVIVGDGPEKPAAEKWVHENGLADRVVFLGERRDIPSVLPAFDVFAYYTEKDALGNVLLEAAAAGVPIVATDIEGTREALAAVGGKAVPLEDFEAFSSAVEQALSEKKAEKKPFPPNFTSTFMCREYQRLYNELLREASHGS